MATIETSNTNWSKSSTMRITYTAYNGYIQITGLEGKRNDNYESYLNSAYSLKINGTNCSLKNYIYFGKKTYKSFNPSSAFTVNGSGNTEITITLPTGSVSWSGCWFKVTINIPPPMGSFNLNVLNPDGSEPYSTGEAGTVQFSSDGGSSYSRIYNEPSGEYVQGTAFRAKNFEPGAHRYLSSTSGFDGGSGTDGDPWYTTQGSSTTLNFYTAWNRYWNDVNVYNPNGVQDYESAYFDLYTSENDSHRYNLLNEDNDMTHVYGSYFEVSNIRPYHDYYELDHVNGYDSIPTTGTYRKTFDAASEVLGVYMRYKSYTIIIRKGTGIADITAPNWGWTGNYKTNSLQYGTSLNINVSLATGYHWKNWSGTFSTTTQNYTFTVTGAVDITANGEANTYTVNYNANGGTGTTASSSHTYNVAKNLTSNGFSRTGYEFLGWSTNSSATTATYSNGQSVTNLTSTNGATVILYAIWRLVAPTNVVVTPTYTTRSKILGTVSCTGANITNYTLYYRRSGETSYLSITLGTTTSFTITELSPNTTYDIYAIATNAAGTTQGSSSSAITKAYIPQFTSITSSNISSSGFTINYSATGDTYAAITGYYFYRSINPGFTKNTYDMPVKMLSDNSWWARIFYHNCKEGTVLFDSIAECRNVQTADKYSRLYLLEDDTYKINGKFEFMLCYPDESSSQYNRWKQTNAPQNEFVTVTASGTDYAAGYEAVHIDWTDNYWGGMTRQNSDATTITDTWLSGSVGHSNWFYALGAIESWEEGIPSSNSLSHNSTFGEVELWVRIDTIPNIAWGPNGTSTSRTFSSVQPETQSLCWVTANNAIGTGYSPAIYVTTLPKKCQIDYKVNGTWKKGDVYIKIGEVWKLSYKQSGDTNFTVETYTSYDDLLNALNQNIIVTDVQIEQISESWKQAEKVYIKVNGVWKEAKN